ncbi:hypothetical protein [Escherichia coli]|uniref:hypothetical protein n=1 Tax=Escherichia coli TaxID=562 RepID=UPI0012FFFD21|nr:hypothetical protein [Escherichia coli]
MTTPLSVLLSLFNPALNFVGIFKNKYVFPGIQFNDSATICTTLTVKMGYAFSDNHDSAGAP